MSLARWPQTGNSTLWNCSILNSFLSQPEPNSYNQWSQSMESLRTKYLMIPQNWKMTPRSNRLKIQTRDFRPAVRIKLHTEADILRVAHALYMLFLLLILFMLMQGMAQMKFWPWVLHYHGNMCLISVNRLMQSLCRVAEQIIRRVNNSARYM